MHVSPAGQFAVFLHVVVIVALQRPCFTSAFVGIVPFQCSFNMAFRQDAPPLPARSAVTLSPFTTCVGGTVAPESSTHVGAKSMLRTKRSSTRGVVPNGG